MKKQATKDALEQVKEILSRDFYVEEANITESAELVEDLGLDSLDLVELAMSLEEAYELPEISASIYLTQWQHCVQDIFAVAGRNVLLLLPFVRSCATSAKTGCADVVSIDASLTNRTTGGRNWLSLRLPAHAQERKPLRTSAFSSSLKQRARSLREWSFPSHLITASSKLFFRTRLRLASIWSHASVSFLNSSIGNLAVTSRLNDGGLFTVSDFSNIKPKPACIGRVLSSALAYGGSGGDDEECATRVPLQREPQWNISPVDSPAKENWMAVFRIYADESGKLNSKSDYTSFCGFIAHSSEWARFELEWNNVLIKWQIPPFHMARIINPDAKDDQWLRMKKKWGDKWERNREAMLDDFALAIRNSQIVCVGAAVDAKHFRSLADSEFKREAKDPIYFGLHHVVMRGIEKTEVVDKHSPISIVIDDDPEFAKGCYDLINTLKTHSDPRFRKVKERIHGVCFCNDESYPGLQAADMIAYEARKYLVDKMKDPDAAPSDRLQVMTFYGMHAPVIYTASILDEMERGTLEMIRTNRDEGKTEYGI